MEQFIGLPPVASEHGAQVDSLIGILHWLMFALFLGWGFFYLYTLFRFRKSNNPVANYHGVKTHTSSYLEIVVALFEVVLLVGFSIPLWAKRVNAFPSEKESLVVRVVAEQFAWNIHYPGPDETFGKTSASLIDADNPLGLDRNDPAAKDDITTINQFNIPVGKPVIVHLTTKDVIHSFNLPYLRTKQDAIPGMSIPLWFTATKTTAEIQKELAHKIYLKPFVDKTKSVTIPLEQTISISGSPLDGIVLTQDVMDNTGAAILSAGELLNADNVKRLVESQISSVKAREVAQLEKYLSTQEIKDKDGNPVLMKGEMMTEEAVNRAMKAGATQLSVRPSAKLDTYVVMEEYKDNSGNVVLEKNGFVDDAIIDKLVEAGITEITIAPSTPTEIACAQLCGLGHYRMRGYMTIQTPQEYEAWVAEQLSSLMPPAEEVIDSTSTMTDSTSISKEIPQENNQ